ncbi:hypothetical protein SUGI_0960750 [Cryptomeria japonica]|nr:hypothetical protein SUGI_0960750 [Cryptomeria japonica]
MAKGVYVFLLLSLPTAPFAFASEFDVNGDCRGLSGEFHGSCVVWRKGECNSVCKNVDYGQCDSDNDRKTLAC